MELVDKLLPCGHIKRIECYKKPKICQVLVDKLLLCGHTQKNIKCCDEPGKCEILVDKLLPCGHIKKNVKCSDEPGKCEELINKLLPCGHIQKNIKCCEKPKKCEELVDKLLPCGHIKKNVKCCDEPGKCEELVNKLLPCKHIKENCFCYENPKNIKCEKKCKKKLRCGHPCQLKCYENCGNQLCHQKIPYKIESCNHLNNIECYLTSYPIQIICQEPCSKRLPCGHICSGTCGKCLQGTLHIRCLQKCLKRLICGHLCNQKCSSECICKEKYNYLCKHQKCTKNCYKIKYKCSDTCLRECNHSSCKKRCDEICDKKPCNKRCELRMKCGHQCYGLCGEICPNVCEICKINIINNKSKEETNLFYKTICGHVFPFKIIDDLFDKKNIEVYICPECKGPLLLETRYKDKINAFFKNLIKIRRESYDKNMSIKDNTFYLEIKNIIINNLIPQYKFEKINAFDKLNTNHKITYFSKNLNKKLPIIYNLIQKYNDNGIQKNASFYYLMNLAEKFMGVEYYTFLITKKKNIEKIDFDFLKNFNVVKNYFNASTIQFNPYFFNELQRKIDNMLYYAILRLKNENEDENNIGLFGFVFNPKIITCKDISKSYFSLDLKIKDLYDNDDYNKKYIFKSLSSKWYKCPNDHLYTSDEVDNKDKLSCPYCTFGDKAFTLIKNIFGI